MEKFNLSKKIEEAVDQSKRFIKKAVIAGTIVLSTEQALSQELPRENGEYRPMASWQFEEGTENRLAYNVSAKYPGFMEQYILDHDSVYTFNGYYTKDGNPINTPEEVADAIKKVQDKLDIYNNPDEHIRAQLAHQQTDEYKEECYQKVLNDNQEAVHREEGMIQTLTKALKTKNPNSEEYKKIENSIKDHEENLKMFSESLQYCLNNKQKILENPTHVPVYTYEQKISQIAVSKQVEEVKLQNLLQEQKDISSYISKNTKK